MHSWKDWIVIEQHYKDLLRDSEKNRANQQWLQELKSERRQISLPGRFVRSLASLVARTAPSQEQAASEDLTLERNDRGEYKMQT